MRKVTHLLATLVLTVFAVSVCADEGEWISLQPATEGTQPQRTVNQSENGIQVSLETYGFYRQERIEEGGIYNALSIPLCGINGKIGYPAMPFNGIFLEVPNGVQVDLDVKMGTPLYPLTDVQVMPQQEPQPDCGNTTPAFVKDKDAYAVDSWIPERIASLTQDAIVHGHRVIFIEVHPLQFNPALEQIRAYPHLTLSIMFKGNPDEAAQAAKETRRTPFFDDLIASIIANPQGMRAAPPSLKANPTGIEYLVIADDPLVTAVTPLVDWKKLKGYTAEVVPFSTVGSTADDLKTYLQNRYNSDPDLTWVLLVGDQGQIPGYPVTPDAYGNPFISDLTYSCLSGADYLPDIVLGRLSVQTATECTNVVNKILTYDRTPDLGSWYNDALIAAYLQDSDSGCTADRWFFETGTHVMHFLEDNNLFTIHTAMTSDSLSCNPYSYRSDSYPHRPAGYAGGVNVPTADAALITNESQSTSDVSTAVNGGVAIVQHRDHGGETLWGDPPFDNGNVNSLTNGVMTPVVFSINCLTGRFDYSSGDCFAEAWQKKSSGGAVGLVAAVRVSYSGFNDLLTYGTYDCFWNDFDTADGGNNYGHSWRPAEALMYGKYYMFHWEGNSADTEYEFRLFHWFGDPEMMMRDDTQITPTVTTSCPIPVGSTTLTVNCNVEGALVAVTDNGTLLGRATVSGGVATVTLDPAPSVPTTLDVVVTGHNVDPWEGSCEVIVPSGPWLTHNAHTIDDSAGNGDGIANPGETILMPVTLENIGADNGTGIVGTLSTTSTYTTITDSAATYPDIPVGATGQSNPDHYTFTLDGATPNGHLVPFTVSWSATGGYSGDTQFSVPVCEILTISNVQISNVTKDSAVVTWTTNVPADSKVMYGTSKPPTLEAYSSTLVTDHSVTLTGLTNCTEYFVSVSSTSEGCYTVTDTNGGSWYSFQTLGSLYTFGPDDVEAGAGSWTASGEWHIDTCKANSPTHAWKSGSTTCPGTYSDSTDSYLTSGFIDIGTGGYHLIFSEWYDLESQTTCNYDSAQVQISTDGGGSWTTLGSRYCGASTGWQSRDIDLSTYTGTVQIRFWMHTDGSVTGEGWYVDDIEISKPAACGPHAQYDTHALVADSCTGTGGSVDGIWDAGEQVQFSVDIKNDGTDALTGVTATITPLTTGMTMVDGTATYADLAVGATGTSQAPHFTVQLPETANCGDTVDFQIDISSNEGGPWTSTFSQVIGQVIPGGGNLLTEGFETAVPPAGWNAYQTGDAADPGWIQGTTGTPAGSHGDPHTGTYYAWHNDDDLASDAVSWLVTPQLVIPSGATSVTLDIWQRDYYDTYYQYHGVWVTTGSDPDPSVSTYVELWSGDVTNAWVEQQIDLTSYAGQSIYIAFRYEGDYQDEWYLDDISVDYTAPGGCNMTPCTGGTVPEVSDDAAHALKATKNGSNVDLLFEDVGASHYQIYVSNAPATNPFAVASSANGKDDCGFSGWTSQAGGMLQVTNYDLAAGITGETTRLYFLITADSGSGSEGPLGYATGPTARTADARCNQ